MSDNSFLLHPEALPRLGQRISLRILRLIGWRVRYKPLPGPHGVVIVYPHTSNWDVVIGLLAKWAIGVPFRWLAKEALFRGVVGHTIGRVLKRWGSVPVERHSSTGATQRLVQTMFSHDSFWLALAPEGTRSHRPHWRSGFYHLTVAAKVPLLVVYMDYPNKEVGVVDYLELTGDQEKDMAAIRAVYAGHQGLHPELAAPIQFAPPRAD